MRCLFWLHSCLCPPVTDGQGVGGSSARVPRVCGDIREEKRQRDAEAGGLLVTQ